MSVLNSHETVEHYRINNSGNYVKQSFWTHSDTVTAPDGDVLSDKINAGAYIGNTITQDDTEITIAEIDDTTTSANKTWSSEKITNEIDSKTEINDALTGEETTWSSALIQSKIAAASIDDTTTSTETTWSSSNILSGMLQHYTVNGASGSVVIKMIPAFEGFFAIVNANRTSTGVIGIVDHWHTITYIQNNTTFATIQSVDADHFSVSNILKDGNALDVYILPLKD